MKISIIDGKKYCLIKECELNEMLASAFEKGIARGSKVAQDAIYSNINEETQEDSELLCFSCD